MILNQRAGRIVPPKRGHVTYEKNRAVPLALIPSVSSFHNFLVKQGDFKTEKPTQSADAAQLSVRLSPACCAHLLRLCLKPMFET